VAGGPSGVKHAPGNDPFVITVGAVDLNNSARPVRHDVPSWSAWGYTNEGFAKPDLVAAGRYMVGPVPTSATLLSEKPENLVSTGYMRLSGTSFATPVVAGIAAQVLARHPEYTPDQVKGVLMATARRIPDASALEQGRGEVNAVRAAYYSRTPPNANMSLNGFVVADPAGGSLPVWDASAWYDHMQNDSAWDSSGWADSAWLDSGWADSGWADSAWNDSAWLDSAWLDSAWADSTSYEDNAEGDGVGEPEPLTPTAAAEIASDPALALP
jgi:serine protease AprX